MIRYPVNLTFPNYLLRVLDTDDLQQTTGPSITYCNHHHLKRRDRCGAGWRFTARTQMKQPAFTRPGLHVHLFPWLSVVLFNLFILYMKADIGSSRAFVWSVFALQMQMFFYLLWGMSRRWSDYIIQPSLFLVCRSTPGNGSRTSSDVKTRCHSPVISHASDNEIELGRTILIKCKSDTF